MANASTVSSKTCSKSLNGKIFQFSSLRISAVCECTEEDKAGLPKYFRHLPTVFDILILHMGKRDLTGINRSKDSRKWAIV